MTWAPTCFIGAKLLYRDQHILAMREYVLIKAMKLCYVCSNLPLKRLNESLLFHALSMHIRNSCVIENLQELKQRG